MQEVKEIICRPRESQRNTVVLVFNTRLEFFLLVFSVWLIPCRHVPKGLVVPWPIEFVVSAFHKKHRFVESKAPTLKEIGGALKKWQVVSHGGMPFHMVLLKILSVIRFF